MGSGHFSNSSHGGGLHILCTFLYKPWIKSLVAALVPVHFYRIVSTRVLSTTAMMLLCSDVLNCNIALCPVPRRHRRHWQAGAVVGAR